MACTSCRCKDNDNLRSAVRFFFAATMKRTPDYRLRQQKDNKNSSDSLDVVVNLSLTTQSRQNDKTYFILSTVPGDIRKAVAERYVIYSNISLPAWSTSSLDKDHKVFVCTNDNGRLLPDVSLSWTTRGLLHFCYNKRIIAYVTTQSMFMLIVPVLLAKEVGGEKNEWHRNAA